MYVTAYAVTQEYGGPEEGGWYYDWYRLLRSVPVPEGASEEDIEKMKDDLAKMYAHENYGKYNSVLGGQKVVVFSEDHSGESETLSRPRFE